MKDERRKCRRWIVEANYGECWQEVAACDQYVKANMVRGMLERDTEMVRARVSVRVRELGKYPGVSSDTTS